MNECYESWSAADGNWSGRCCCNCKWQRPISGHPWNKVPSFNSRVSSVIAWGCTVPDMPNIVLSERGHGMCETHERPE